MRAPEEAAIRRADFYLASKGFSAEPPDPSSQPAKAGDQLWGTSTLASSKSWKHAACCAGTPLRPHCCCIRAAHDVQSAHQGVQASSGNRPVPAQPRHRRLQICAWPRGRPGTSKSSVLAPPGLLQVQPPSACAGSTLLSGGSAGALCLPEVCCCSSTSARQGLAKAPVLGVQARPEHKAFLTICMLLQGGLPSAAVLSHLRAPARRHIHGLPHAGRAAVHQPGTVRPGYHRRGAFKQWGQHAV